MIIKPSKCLCLHRAAPPERWEVSLLGFRCIKWRYYLLCYMKAKENIPCSYFKGPLNKLLRTDALYDFMAVLLHLLGTIWEWQNLIFRWFIHNMGQLWKVSVTRSNPTKARFIFKAQTPYFTISEHMNSNPSMLCGSWARWRERDTTCHAPYICKKGVFLSNKGIRKGSFICENGIQKGMGLDLGTESPVIELCREALRATRIAALRMKYT